MTKYQKSQVKKNAAYIESFLSETRNGKPQLRADVYMGKDNDGTPLYYLYCLGGEDNNTRIQVTLKPLSNGIESKTTYWGQVRVSRRKDIAEAITRINERMRFTRFTLDFSTGSITLAVSVLSCLLVPLNRHNKRQISNFFVALCQGTMSDWLDVFDRINNEKVDSVEKVVTDRIEQIIKRNKKEEKK